MSTREPVGTIAHTVKSINYTEILDVTNTLGLKTKPREHQARAIYAGIDQDTFLYALDMGTGKTKIALDLISTHKLMRGSVKALVTCPPVVLRQWNKENEKHSELRIQIVDGSDTKSKLRQLATKADIVVVSHSYLVSLFGRATKNKNVREHITTIFNRFEMLIVDEAHVLKNPQTKGFEGYKKYLLNIERRYLLTGTPIGNSYTGVWSLYYLLDKGATFGDSYSLFLIRYFNVYSRGLFDTYRLRKDKKVEFMELFWTRAIRWEEEECSDLPGKTSIVKPITMSAEQEKAYDEVLTAARQGYDAMREPEFELMRITAGIHNKQSPKMDALKELVREICVDNNQQFIIWCWLREENEYIHKELENKFRQLNIRCIKGDADKNAKDKILDDWAENKVDILIANQKSLGVGIDLYEASSCCFFSNNRSVIDRKQAEKRIHRTGQTKHCFYIDLVCEQTIDEINLSIVQKASNAFTELTKDGRIMQLVNKQRNLI